MYLAGVICLCLMLTSDVVVATQELTPPIFSSNHIDLNTCDWNQAICNLDSFINSGLDLMQSDMNQVRPQHRYGGKSQGCNPQHMSIAWYQDKCLNKSE